MTATKKPCKNGCGRTINTDRRDVCRPCLKAERQGYHLSPAPAVGELAEPDRDRRIALYGERASRQEPLFDEVTR